MSRRKYQCLRAFILIGIGTSSYWLVTPSITASKFVQSIGSEDFAAADKMFVDPADEFLLQRFEHEDSWAFRAHAEIESISVSQLLYGTREVSIELAFGKPGRVQVRGWKMKALRAGIDTPEESWQICGGMAIAAQ